MPTGNYVLLGEGLLHVLVACAILYTLYRRGPQAVLWKISVFLLVLGTADMIACFSTGHQAAVVRVSPSWEFVIHLVYHLSAFFGLAAYATIPAMLFLKKRLGHVITIGSWSTATVLLIIHMMPLEVFHLRDDLHVFFTNLGDATMVGFFVLTLGVTVVVLGVLFIDLLKQKHGGLDYTTTVWTGTGLLIAGSLIYQVLVTVPATFSADLFVAIVVVIVVAGFIVQMSLAALPGIVYNMQTKKPIPLAIVRLFSQAEKKIIASAVAEEDGRYVLMVAPGTYTLQIQAPGYVVALPALPRPTCP